MKETCPRIKIIVVSGYKDFKYTQQAIRSGAVEYLLKPIDPVQFKKALEACIHRLRQDRVLSGVLVTLSSDMMRQLAQFKKNIRTHLDMFALPSEEEEIEKSILCLDHQFACDAQQWLRVYYEFRSVLEHFVAAEGLELQEILNPTTSEHHAPLQLTASGVLEALLTIYRETVNFLMARRKERKTVDMDQIYHYIQTHLRKIFPWNIWPGGFF